MIPLKSVVFSDLIAQDGVVGRTISFCFRYSHEPDTVFFLILITVVRYLSVCALALAPAVLRADNLIDRVDEAMTGSAFHDQLRARISGTIDLEGYQFSQPAPSLIYSDGHALFNPRLTLFLDVQAGSHVYLFAQSRVDRGFDPVPDKPEIRLDEYALRFTASEDALLNLQIGKFASIIGTWNLRHGSWDNPFISPPLVYENVTGVWDSVAADSTRTLLRWAHVKPNEQSTVESDKDRRNPVVWGPSYTSGAAVFGSYQLIEYAVEIKNASLSSRPDNWDPSTSAWDHPTFNAHLGYNPSEKWKFGVSASSGTYLVPRAKATIPQAYGFNDYRQRVLAQDITYAWHHLQVWAECYECRFENPRVGNIDTLAYYIEAKYKFTPQLFGAIRWNQQVYGTVTEATGENTAWSHNLCRLDLAPTYRFTPNTQAKLQYSVQHAQSNAPYFVNTFSGQLTVRF